MPSQLQKGHTYNPGDVVDAADLNNLVDAGTVLKGAITEAITATPTTPTADWVWYYNNAVGDLRKCHISQLPTGVTSIDMTATPTTVFGLSVTHPTTDTTIALSLKNQSLNKVLIAPADGSPAQPTFRTLVPADMTVPTVQIAAVNIDWSLGNVFDKTLTASTTTFTFSNVDNGQTIRVRVRQTAAGTAVVNWDATPLTIIWTDGIVPVLPTIPNGYGIFVFTVIVQSGVYRIHGHLEQVLNPAVVASQTANTFFAGPISGAVAAPSFRAIQPVDLPIGTIYVAAGVVDCTGGNVFLKTLPVGTGPFGLAVNGLSAGQTVRVGVNNNAAGNNRITWATDSGTLIWRGGGPAPVVTQVGNARDIFTFTKIDVAVYGYADQDFKV